MKSKKMKCPQCGKEFEVDESCDRPFCSSRCKLIDLGNWLDESYTIASQDEELEQ